MTQKIRVILVDDEPLAVRGLEIRLKEFEDIEIIDTCANGKEAVRQIKLLKPDLVFLDIQMPGFDGFAVLRSLMGEVKMPLVVFVTAYDQYALDAFEQHALDYLLKPVEQERLAETIFRAREQISHQNIVAQNAQLLKMIEEVDGSKFEKLASVLDEKSDTLDQRYDPHIRIKDRGHITIVSVNDVDYIDAAGDYMCIHVGDKTHILRETMKVMEKRLDPKVFQRIHRSIIINLEKVREVLPHANGESYLVLENNAKLKVSRSYKEIIGRFL